MTAVAVSFGKVWVTFTDKYLGIIGGCSYTNRDGVSVHKLPKDEALCEKWDRFVPGFCVTLQPRKGWLATCYVVLLQKALVLRL